MEEVPKFNAIVLTNVKAIRSYLYILKFYEKIDFDLLQTKANPHLNRTQGNLSIDNIDKIPDNTTRKSLIPQSKNGSNKLLGGLISNVINFDGESKILNKSVSSNNE